MGNYVYFRNDTDFEVKIFDYDENRTLYPGETEKNGLAKGPYYVELMMKFPTYNSDRKRFESSKFEGQTEYMSRIFGKEIEEYREKERRKKEKSGGGQVVNIGQQIIEGSGTGVGNFNAPTTHYYHHGN